MKKAVIKKDGATVIPQAEIADSFASRFRGLMFRKSIPEDYGLVISPCKQIHMFNMRFAIDVIYLSREGRVVHIDPDMKPGAVGKTVKEAELVIEVLSGVCAKLGITQDDILSVENI